MAGEASVVREEIWFDSSDGTSRIHGYIWWPPGVAEEDESASAAGQPTGTATEPAGPAARGGEQDGSLSPDEVEGGKPSAAAGTTRAGDDDGKAGGADGREPQVSEADGHGAKPEESVDAGRACDEGADAGTGTAGGEAGDGEDAAKDGSSEARGQASTGAQGSVKRDDDEAGAPGGKAGGKGSQATRGAGEPPDREAADGAGEAETSTGRAGADESAGKGGPEGKDGACGPEGKDEAADVEGAGQTTGEGKPDGSEASDGAQDGQGGEARAVANAFEAAARSAGGPRQANAFEVAARRAATLVATLPGAGEDEDAAAAEEEEGQAKGSANAGGKPHPIGTEGNPPAGGDARGAGPDDDAEGSADEPRASAEGTDAVDPDGLGGPDASGPDGDLPVVKGVVQIVHGMAEYVGRYDEFARFLAEAGYIVCGHDHIYHGLSAPRELLGKLPGGSKRVLIADVGRLRTLMRERLGGVELPYFVFGHSLGSFITRAYVAREGDGLAGAIICGTGHVAFAKSAMGNLASHALGLVHRGGSESPLLTAMGTGAYARAVRHRRTANDWLSYDEANVDAYNADELCGFAFSPGGYAAVTALTREVCTLRSARRAPRQLPLLFIGGDADPVGENGEGVRAAAHLARVAGSLDVTCMIYRHMRHEVLNETDRAMVFDDVLFWLEVRS